MVTDELVPAVRVLVVCRFNQARSPLTAHLLRIWADDHQLRPPPVVASSGVYAEPAQTLLPEVARVLAARGYDAPDHEPRRFQLPEAQSSTLVITFERALLHDIIRKDPALADRTFTLREIQRIVLSPLWDESSDGANELASRLHRLRPRVPAGDDDTPDPTHGRGRHARRILTSVLEDSLALAPVVLGGQSGRSGP